MTLITATEAQKRLYDLIDETIQSHLPVMIKGKNNNAVLVSEEDWSSIQETLFLLSVPKMRESIHKGMNSSVDKCDKSLKW